MRSMVTEYIGTPAGVREICRNLQIPEIPDSEIFDDLKYGYGQLLLGTGKDDWDGSERVYGMAVKVNEEYAAVNIALRTNVPIDTVALIRKIADQDLDKLINADPSLLTSTITGDTASTRHGSVREYQYWTMNDEDIYDHYITPEMN